MRRPPVLLLAAVLAFFMGSAPARADQAAATSAAAHFAAARAAYDRGDYTTARDELLAAYRLDPDPQDLFALGQVEFNLGHYKEAIDYYTRFNATNPPSDQAALAQQAIGAARMKLDTPPPDHGDRKVVLPPPPPHREWDRLDTALAITGGVAILAGAGLVGFSVSMAGDQSGTLDAYDHRLSDAHTARAFGIGTASVGALAIGAALLRWRFVLVPSVRVEATPSRVGIVWEHRL